MAPSTRTRANPGGLARIRREKKTVRAMIELYCREEHGSPGSPCEECANLLDYALRRLDCCPYGSKKPTCAECPIHCYRPERRERIKSVMSFAGPRMIWRHPVLALLHMADSLMARFRPSRRIGY